MYTTRELGKFALGPAIFVAGTVEAGEFDVSAPSSPPSSVAIVNFPPLPGSSDKFVVILTPLNAAYAYVTDMIEDSEGNMTGFSLSSSQDATVMYMVVSKGVRPRA